VNFYAILGSTWIRGVAARVLALQQHMEKPTSRVTYTVVLEGRCRFGVQEFNVHDLYNTARVTQLDSTKAGTSLFAVCFESL
jgi:ATP-dependent Lon protease